MRKSADKLCTLTPICLDTADVREAAFYCILRHLRTVAKNHESVVESTRTLQQMIDQANGDGSGKMVGQACYWRIRAPPFSFVDHYGNSDDPRQWLQVNSSTPKQSTRRLLRFVTEVNCFARMKTNNRLPWGTDQDEGAEGSQAKTYREKWPLFADCLAG